MEVGTIVLLVVMFLIGFSLWVALFAGFLWLRSRWWQWTGRLAPSESVPAPGLVAVGAVVGGRVFVSVPPGPVGALPAAVWRPDVVAWEVSLDDLDTVRLELAARGACLLLVRVPEPMTSSGSWAADMFAALPPELHESVRRALAKVLHPDKGGDAAAFRTVTDASLHAGR